MSRRPDITIGRRAVFRGVGGRAWVPPELGSKLVMWISPEASGLGDFNAAATTLGAGGRSVADFSRTGTAYADRVPFSGYRAVHCDNGTFWSSATQLSAVVGTGGRWRRMSVLMVEAVDPTSTGTDAGPAVNSGEIIDNGGYHGVFLRSMGGGLYRVQLYQWDGVLKCTSVALSYTEGQGPIIVDAWYDATNINLAVYYNGTWTTATPVASGPCQVTTGALRVGVGFSGGRKWTGFFPESVHCNADLTAAEVTQLRTYLVNKYQAASPAKRFISSLAKAWGNSKGGGTTDVPDYSGHAMQVFTTTSDDADVRLYQQSTGLDAYARAAIMRGGASAVAPDTEVLQPNSYPSAGDIRNPVTIGGSGSRRLFVIGSPYGAPNQTVAETWLRAGATTTHETPGTARIVTIEGQAGQALALDGYSATGGVIDGGAAATARAAFVTRITNYVSNYSLGSASLVLWFAMGTNDMGAGTLSSNFQVALDQWVTDMRSIAAINTCPIVIQSITRRTAYEGTTAPGYRTAANTVATSRSLTYVNGLTIYADADLSDGVHAKITAQPQHVTQIMTTLTSLSRASTGHVLLYGDSIINGSAGTPQDWAAARGLPMLLKQARAAA